MENVEVRRSARRRKTVQAYRKDGKIIVQVPAHLSAEAERECIERMVASLDRRERRSQVGDDDLAARARLLDDRYFEGAAQPASVRWVSNQNRRWGSCSYRSRTIRLSDRMIGMPAWVIDYIVVHELAHLVVPHDGHGAAFHRLVAQYPRAERAEGFLRGFEYGRGSAQSSDSGGESESAEGWFDSPDFDSVSSS